MQGAGCSEAKGKKLNESFRREGAKIGRAHV